MNAIDALWRIMRRAVPYSRAWRRLWPVKNAVMSYLSTAGINLDIHSFLARWAYPKNF